MPVFFIAPVHRSSSCNAQISNTKPITSESTSCASLQKEINATPASVVVGGIVFLAALMFILERSLTKRL